MRIERDSMGEIAVPEAALYGAATQRAVQNFPVSGHRLPVPFIRTLGLVKWAAAETNAELGLLPRATAEAIGIAALEIYEGLHDEQFPIDVLQTGSGTSTNMNANEVIARLATTRLGEVVHPNDDVNLGQSSNDIIPTTLHVSVARVLHEDLAPALDELAAALESKAKAWAEIVKIGRTHLMDAVPLTLGQAVSGYAAQARKAAARARRAVASLAELAVGGTAVGTGLNTHPEFGARVCRRLSERTGLSFREADNHFEAQGGRDDCVEVAGHLSAISAALTKVANDLRLLGSGPRAGLAEIKLPALQPGSSIMPGKVNPVMSEMLVQACLYAIGLNTTVVMAGRDGQLELNTTLPLLAHCLHETIAILSKAVRLFTAHCVAGLEANAAQCAEHVSRSLMLVTALVPHLGYDVAARVAKRAFAENRTLREIVLEENLLDAAAVDRALDPRSMVSPGATAPGGNSG